MQNTVMKAIPSNIYGTRFSSKFKTHFHIVHIKEPLCDLESERSEKLLIS